MKKRYGAEALLEKLNGQKGLTSQVFSSDCMRFPGRVTVSIVVPNYDLSKAFYEVSYHRYDIVHNDDVNTCHSTLNEALEYTELECGIQF